MYDYSLFFAQNWLLLLIFFSLIVLIIRLESGSSTNLLSPQKVTLLMNRENAVLIDIREEPNFKEGHIVGSKHLKIQDTDKNNPWTKFKKKKIILVCQNGHKSFSLLHQVKKSVGHDDVMVLQGGIAAWKEDNLPLKRK